MTGPGAELSYAVYASTLVGLSTATAKQQHRPRSTKLGAPSLWEVSIDPVDTSEGRVPLPDGFRGQGNEECEYSYDA